MASSAAAPRSAAEDELLQRPGGFQNGSSRGDERPLSEAELLLDEGGDSAALRLLSGALGAREMFLAGYGRPVPDDPLAARVRAGAKLRAEYGALPSLRGRAANQLFSVPGPAAPAAPSPAAEFAKPREPARKRRQTDDSEPADGEVSAALPAGFFDAPSSSASSSSAASSLSEGSSAVSSALVLAESVNRQISRSEGDAAAANNAAAALAEKLARVPEQYRATTALILRQRERQAVRPTWHAPWELMRVVAGDLGWVRAVAVDPGNEIFFTGSNDGTVKVFDLASGDRLNTLTGHIGAVRGLAACPNLANLISAGEDKSVIAWDLTKNRIAQKFHGHLSGVYCVAVHPTLDNLVGSGGRDSSARIWDVRQSQPVVTLIGHQNTVASIAMQNTQPQLISGSHDGTIRCWDLRKPNGATDVLTHHKKAVRALRFHHSENTFVSGAADNLKVWRCPRTVDEKVTFFRNVSGHNAIVNALAVNQDNVLVSGGDDGSIKFFDWSSGHCFQTIQSHVQPGSLDAEAAIFAMSFDQTGSRLITCEGDKTVKIWREDPEATEETHPLEWTPQKRVKMY